MNHTAKGFVFIKKKTNTYFKLEHRRIQTSESVWRAVDAEISSGSYA